MRFLHIVLICLLILIPSVSAGTAQLSWTKTMASSVCVTAIDTNSAGTLILAGLGNGTIFAYNSVLNSTDGTYSGNLSWSYNTNNTATFKAIKKISADANGNFAWINQANDTGYISSTGAIGSKINGTGRNFTDVQIRADGNMYATTELNPPRITLRNPDGSIYAQNTTFGSATYWTSIGYDPVNEWVVTSNESSPRLYYWNVTSWTGWEEFNPTHTASKNASQQYIDTFPSRASINITASASTKGIIFSNNAVNTTSIIKINDTFYEYNRPNTGSYFWWTPTGNLSNASNWSEQPENSLLNLSYVTGNYYYVVFRPITGLTNYTMYFGNTTFTNSILNQTWTNNGTLFRTNITSSQSWTVPAGVRAVNLTMYGGGGGGTTGWTTHPGVIAGLGGNASTMVQQNNVVVTAGTSTSVSIGTAGAGSQMYVAATAGGTTSFTNSSGTSYTASGGLAGSGYKNPGTGDSGNSSIPGYPTAGTGGTGHDLDWNCAGSNYNSGGSGGIGYGSGGGGGGGIYDYNCGANLPGLGGAGTAGVVQISYYVDDIPIYYYGATPTTTLHSVQARQIGTALNQSSTKDYVGNIMGISVPSNGGLASLLTDTIFYQQYLSNSGIGLTYCATLSTGGYALFAGTTHDVKASNSGTASIEARGSYANIYDAGAVARASSLTGNTIRSVDSAMSSGLFAAFGGDEGKLFMLSKEGAAQWYSYYTGGADTPINAVAVAWDGSSVSVGRFGGTLEYYNTNVSISPVPTPSFVDAQLRVYKDGSKYANQPVTIYSSTATPYIWSPVGTSYTDGGGVLTYTTTTGTYYKFVVNNVPGTTSGEGEAIWQSNTASTIVQIFVLTASTPYEWTASYIAATNNVSVVYSDTIIPTSVIVTVKDLKTNLNVLTRTYTGTQNFNLQYHDQLGNGSYQTTIVINRLGSTVRDQRMVSGGSNYNIALPMDSWLKYGLATLVLMLIAGMFGYSNSRRGGLAVVVIAAVFMVFGFLPMEMITIAMLAAMFAVMSLFSSRVQ